MRERLIQLISNADEECKHSKDCKSCSGYGKGSQCMNYHIADYLIDNGVVVLPCKVGQKVWMLMLWRNPAEIIEGKVSMLQQKADRTWKIRISRRSSVEDITPDEIGKTVFLSREDAERALKGGAE